MNIFYFLLINIGLYFILHIKYIDSIMNIIIYSYLFIIYISIPYMQIIDIEYFLTISVYEYELYMVIIELIYLFIKYCFFILLPYLLSEIYIHDLMMKLFTFSISPITTLIIINFIYRVICYIIYWKNFKCFYNYICIFINNLYFNFY